MSRDHGHSVADYLEAMYFLATPIGEYGPVVTESPVPAARVAEMLAVTPPTASEMLKRLEGEGLVTRGPRRSPILTDKGRREAQRVVRNHRIIERFLTDFMGYTPGECHEHAEAIGDTFTDEMIERLDEKLGHPERCPHGWPIDTSHEVEENRALRPLLEMPAGAEAQIVRLAEHDQDLLQWFYDEELVPGTDVDVLHHDEAAGQLSISIQGDERAIGERAAAGLYVATRA